MQSPFGVPAQTNFVPRERTEPVVHPSDRLWDALAMLLIVAGTTLFLLARNGLASIADGTHTLPTGVTSYVQRADYFNAQSSLGLIMIGAGVAVGLASSIRHVLRRRSSGPNATESLVDSR